MEVRCRIAPHASLRPDNALPDYLAGRRKGDQSASVHSMDASISRNDFRAMNVRLLFALQLFATVFLLGLVPVLAQDAMQLDTAFRDSLLRKPASDGQAAYQQERDRDVSKARLINSRSSRIRSSRPR